MQRDRPSDGSWPSEEDEDSGCSSSLSSSKEDRSLVCTELTVMSLRPSRSESSREYSAGERHVRSNPSYLKCCGIIIIIIIIIKIWIQINHHGIYKISDY